MSDYEQAVFISYAWKGDPPNSLSANCRIRRVVQGSSMRDDVLALSCSAPSRQLPEDPGLSRRRHGFRAVFHLEEH